MIKNQNKDNIIKKTITSLYEVENFLCKYLDLSDALCISKILCRRKRKNKYRFF